MSTGDALRRPFSGGVRVHHVAVLGLYILFRYFLVTASATSTPDDGADHSDHGFTVFHIDFGRVSDPFIICLWVFIGSVTKIIFHVLKDAKAVTVFPESCLLILAGIAIGFLLILTTDQNSGVMTADQFLLFLLPPIILEAGYFMPNRLFFDHLGTILLMAVVGTIFNMFTIGAALYACGLTGVYGEENTPDLLETFLFASLIVAVDPVAVLAVFEEVHVDEILYIVVFGESLLNDAVTIVLYNMFTAFIDIKAENIVMTDVGKAGASFLVVSLGGTLVGIIGGFLTGLITRFTNHVRTIETLFVLMCSYMTYLIAETFHLSGILALTFCGITMKNYVHANISQSSQLTLKYMVKMLANISETLIFIFLGIATINDEHVWNWPFVILTIFFCTLFRAVGVVLLTALANPYRLHKLKMVDQFVMLYGGLRGAISFALVIMIDPAKVPHAPMFVTTTIAVVFWTVFIQGTTIKPLVKLLNVKQSIEKDVNMNERITGRLFDDVTSGIQAILGNMSKKRARNMFKRFDDKYIKPILERDPKKDPKIEETFMKITNDAYIEMVKRNPSACFLSSDPGTEAIPVIPEEPSETFSAAGITITVDSNSNTDRRESSTDEAQQPTTNGVVIRGTHINGGFTYD